MLTSWQAVVDYFEDLYKNLLLSNKGHSVHLNRINEDYLQNKKKKETFYEKSDLSFMTSGPF